MGLDWSQIDILAPALCYIEHLHLCHNQCSRIFSEYQLPKEHFKLLKFVNLEGNGILSWDEVEEFRKLKNLKRMTLNKNFIKKINYKAGWPELYMLSIEDNDIETHGSLDALNDFP
jgi:Leucine-rich repeat (LRR) protein